MGRAVCGHGLFQKRWTIPLASRDDGGVSSDGAQSSIPPGGVLSDMQRLFSLRRIRFQFERRARRKKAQTGSSLPTPTQGVARRCRLAIHTITLAIRISPRPLKTANTFIYKQNTAE
jgi:hypothetical protein